MASEQKRLTIPETENQIILFWHCGRCLHEKPSDVAPKDWARLAAGWTKKGFQIWCERHNINIANFDLLGQQIDYAVKEDA